MKAWPYSRRIHLNNGVYLVTLVAFASIALHSLWSNARITSGELIGEAIPGCVSMGRVTQFSLCSQLRTISAASISDPAIRNREIRTAREKAANAGQAILDFEKAVKSDEDRQNYQTLKLLRSKYVAVQDKTLALIDEGKFKEALDVVANELDGPYVAYRDQILAMQETSEKRLLASTARIETLNRSGFKNATLVGLVGVVVALVASTLIVRGLNRSMQEITECLRQSAVQLVSASGLVSSASQSLSQGASQQAASLEETSASLEEIASMTKSNADGAGSAKELSAQAKLAADTGSAAVHELRNAMTAVKTSSSEIGKIIKTIDEIAFQTNILALNAAVEAARAGDAGLGFAVVADEVRQLAQRAATAARETAGKIEAAILTGERGVQISDKVSHAFEEIAAKAREVDGLVCEIATASREQSQGITQINTSMSHVEQVTQANASSAEESASAAEQLNAQAQQLNGTVAQLSLLVPSGR